MHTLPSLFLVRPYSTMLKMIDSLSELDFRQLMDLYAETNMFDGKAAYPEHLEGLQVLYAEQDFYIYLEEFFSEPTAKYAIWIVNGSYMSALRIERYNDGILLNALETAPRARNMGYAKKLILSVLDHLRCDGHGVLYSHVNKQNAASLKLHLSCGFQIISDTAEFLDGSIRPDSYTFALEY